MAKANTVMMTQFPNFEDLNLRNFSKFDIISPHMVDTDKVMARTNITHLHLNHDRKADRHCTQASAEGKSTIGQTGSTCHRRDGPKVWIHTDAGLCAQH